MHGRSMVSTLVSGAKGPGFDLGVDPTHSVGKFLCFEQLININYTDRLKMLNLPTLKYRRKRGDLIQVFKILNGHYDINWEDFFTLDTDRNPGRFAPDPVRPLDVSPQRRFAPGRFAPGRFAPLVISPLVDSPQEEKSTYFVGIYVNS